MTELSSKIIPNSFQTPNFYVDECMSFLTGNEYKCLSYLARKTFGWQKRSDRISKSQIVAATGLSNETVDKTMTSLTEFGLLLRVAENNPQNTGTEWALQIDDSQVRFDLLQERQEKAIEAQRQKTQKGREKLAERRGGLSNNPPSERVSVGQKPSKGGIVGQLGGGIVQQLGGGSVGQSPQKPIKAKESHMGASAPARVKIQTRKSDPPEQAIAAFPTDCQEGAGLMQTLFKVIPPAKPAAHDKGSDFADWIKSIRALNKLAAQYNVPLEQAFALTWADWNKNVFRVARPGALIKSMTAVLAKTKLRVDTSTPDQPEAEQRLIVRNPFPRPASLPSSKSKRK